MEVLTANKVKLAARKAYSEGWIQGKCDFRTDCAYAVGSYRCAVGAALSEETIHEIAKRGLNWVNVGTLSLAQVVCMSSAEDAAMIDEIQRKHDDWCSCMDPKERRRAEKEFLNWIGYQDPEYMINLKAEEKAEKLVNAICMEAIKEALERQEACEESELEPA